MKKNKLAILLLCVIICVMLTSACTNGNLEKTTIYVSGGDFAEILGKSEDELEFSHYLTVSKDTAQYELKIAGGKTLTITANGEIETMELKDGTEIYFLSLTGETKINGENYLIFANVDKEIAGEKLFASITIQNAKGSKSCFLSVGTPIVFVEE